MDRLLMKTPSQLANEREELFGLIDRFADKINTFQKEYENQQKQCEKEINNREQEKTDALNNNIAEYKKNKNSLHSRYSQESREIELKIDEEKKYASEKIDNEEDKCKKAIDDLRNKHIDDNQSEAENLRSYKATVSQMKKLFSRLDTIIGYTHSGISKLELMSKDIKLDIIPINDTDTAVNYLSERYVTEAERVVSKIQTITESLPRKIFQNKKRIEYIKVFLESKKNAENALLVMERNIRNNQAERQRVFDQNRQAFCATRDREKQKIITQKEKRIKELENNKTNISQKYKKDTDGLYSKHISAYDRLKKHHDDQISIAKNNWKNSFIQISHKFVKSMEEEFPAERMNDWINQFWYHPRSVEQYKYVCNNYNLSMLLGIASVDISSWVSGQTGQIVSNVLLKYYSLFGRDKEQMNQSYKNNIILLPYSISIENGESILISHDELSGDRAKAMLNGIAMRLMNSVPACKMRFLLFDDSGFSAFSRLKQFDPANKNNPSEPTVKSIVLGEGKKPEDIHKHIEELCSSLSEIEGQMNKYDSIRDFNKDNPLSERIFKPILMANYPSGLNKDDLKMLKMLISDGSKWGCSVFCAEPDNKAKTLKPELEQMKNELDEKLTKLRMGNNFTYLVPYDVKSTTEKNSKVMIYGLPDSNSVEKVLAPDFRKRSVKASRFIIDLFKAQDIFVEKSQRFREVATDGIVVPIGYLESGDPLKLQFDDASHVNAMLMGQTGSGKSNFLHALLMGVLLRYDPSEVKIYLIDFKKGLDFSIYTKYYLPSFAAIGVNSEPEFAMSVLEEVLNEFTKRKGIIDGSNAKKISDANRNNPNKKLCRILLIIDELYVLSEKADDELQRKIISAIDELTHQGRSFGIHTIVSGQDLEKINGFNEIKKQCKTRFCFHCEDNQVKELLHESAVGKMHSIDENDQGACVFSINNGLNPHIERTVYVDDKKQGQVLNEISEHYRCQNRPEITKVLHTRIMDNPNHPLQLFVTHGVIPQSLMNLEVGDPFSMDRQMCLRPSENLLVAGGSGSDKAYEAAQSVMFFSAYSMLLNKLSVKNLKIYCSNCTHLPYRNNYEEEKDIFGMLTSKYDKFFIYDKGKNIKKTLEIIHKEIDIRKNDPAQISEALWWFVIRPESIPGLYEDNAFVIDFMDVLTKGPSYNVHVIMWSYDIKHSQIILSDKNAFQDKLCIEMSNDELISVMGNDIKPSPQGYKAIVVGRSTMRFRVFDFPGTNGHWMNKLFDRLKEIEKRFS